MLELERFRLGGFGLRGDRGRGVGAGRGVGDDP